MELNIARDDANDVAVRERGPLYGLAVYEHTGPLRVQNPAAAHPRDERVPRKDGGVAKERHIGEFVAPD